MIALLGASIGDFDITTGGIALGVFTGSTYALLAAGLVLVFRSSGVINFAHSSIGLLGAAFMSLAIQQYGVPYWVAFAFGVLVSAGAGAATEVVVVKPLARSPKVIPMVAMLGLSTFFIVLSLALNPDGLSGEAFPQPAGMPTGEIGSLLITKPYAAQGIISPLLLLALGVFLWLSRTGLAIRGAAANADAASMSGVSPRSMMVWSWTIAGGVSAVAAMFILPTAGVVTPASLGPELLLRGLAAAAIARFASFSVAVVVALAIGVIEQVLATNPAAKGWIEIIILAAVAIALAAERQRGRRAPEAWTEIGAPVRRRLTPTSIGIAVIAFAAAATVPLYASASDAVNATIVISVAIVGVSVTLITGLGGQLTLAQFALGGIAGAVSVRAAGDGIPFGLAIVCGAIIAGAVSVLIALPALRVRGPQLAVATLSFALVASAYLLDQDWLLGGRSTPSRPAGSIGDTELSSGRGYYWVALVALALVLIAVRFLRQSAFARQVVAVRDNEDAARALAVSATGVKLQLAMVGGAVAGVGGAIYAHAYTSLSSANFPISLSIDAVTVAVIGGIGSLLGPVIGALYLVGLPLFFTPPAEALAGIAGLWLILVTKEPRGVAGLADQVRARLAGRVGPIDDAEHHAHIDREPNATERPSGRLLQIDGVSRSFGPVVAVSDVSMYVDAGEIVGLIGPNGAGKTTLFEIISGFTRPSSGGVMFLGSDVSRLGPTTRARRGLGRTFQSAQLFPSLTVLETVMMALGRGRASHDAARARELLDEFGILEHRHVVVGNLPTGLRRVLEMTCAFAARPSLVLLDEPTAGLSSAEREDFAQNVLAWRERTGIGIVIIEHDLGILNKVCDRLIAMNLGRKIAEGRPDDVCRHPDVVASYTG